MSGEKADIIAALRKEILSMQGYKAAGDHTAVDVGLKPIMNAFPHGIFPTGTIHELLTDAPEHTASSAGFVTALLSTLMRQGGVCLWISTTRRFFAPALRAFQVEPDRFIFIDLHREKDVLWAMEEALKCGGLAAVIADLAEISFTQSRRLQLAVEQSRVTGFILRTDPRKLNQIASVAQWRIRPEPSQLEDDMPGVGFPRWKVELIKVRNGQPGMWQVEWAPGRFMVLPERMEPAASEQSSRQAG